MMTELLPDPTGNTTYWAFYAPTFEGEPCDIGEHMRWRHERELKRQEREWKRLRAAYAPRQQFANPLVVVLGNCRCAGPLCDPCKTANLEYGVSPDSVGRRGNR